LGTKGELASYIRNSAYDHCKDLIVAPNTADPRYQVKKAEHCITLWLFHIAMEIYPFKDYLPIKKIVVLSLAVLNWPQAHQPPMGMGQVISS
jgi:hypothetical protein